MIGMMAWLQLVVVVDAVLADTILGSQEGLSKAMEPDLSDALISHGHRTMFSSETNSPYWRLIRKGTAPAFISANIKCASAFEALHLDPKHLFALYTAIVSPAYSVLAYLKPVLCKLDRCMHCEQLTILTVGQYVECHHFSCLQVRQDCGEPLRPYDGSLWCAGMASRM